MAYIRTCVQNLGEIRRPVRNNCPSSLIIDYRIFDDMRHPVPRVRQPTPHMRWVDAMWVSL